MSFREIANCSDLMVIQWVLLGFKGNLAIDTDVSMGENNVFAKCVIRLALSSNGPRGMKNVLTNHHIYARCS